MNHPNYGKTKQRTKNNTRKTFPFILLHLFNFIFLCLYIIISFQAINAQIRKFKQLLKIAFYHFHKRNVVQYT